MNAPTRLETLVPLHAWSEPAPDTGPAQPAPRARLSLEAAVFALCIAASVAVLAAASWRDVLAFPYSDAHDWAADVLGVERSGDWAAYLWSPHGQQRIPWARLAEALSLEARGQPPAFLLIGAALWALGVGALVGLLVRSRAAARTRLWVGAGAAMLLACAALAEDFAFPVFSVYLYAAGPALAAACLWAATGERGLRSPWFWAALVCAVLASGGNAAGLAIWPALVGAALLAGETGAALWVLIVAAVACAVVVEAGLGTPGGAPNASSAGAARLFKMAVYFGSYCGLPWSRALRAPWLGAAFGWPIAVAAGLGLRKAWRLRMQADRARSLRRAGSALALFGLATALLAALGRVDELAQAIVPTRYTPFALVLQVGVIMLHADVLELGIARRPLAACTAAAAGLGLILAADLRGARLLDRTADQLRADSRAFDSGFPTSAPMYPRPERAHAVRRALIARGLPG